mmetsp:Transcript_20189/g.40194  ORF Transcript_20189/g.40194 Transcript_20189/m.40194 type:complete len:260 (+) Transcript_20189:42-821(+)
MMLTFAVLVATAVTANGFALSGPSSARDAVILHATRREIFAGFAAAVPVTFVGISPVFATDKKTTAAPAEKKTAAPANKKTATASKKAPADFAGVYTDPKHPRGYRVITSTGSLELQDEPKGTTFTIPVKTKFDKKKGETALTIDFSVKGGPKDIVGVYKDGKITFPDGNVWPKSTGLEGVYTDPKHPEGYRVVRFNKQGSVVLDLTDDGKPPVLKIMAKSKGNKLTIDFSSKGGPKNLPASFENGEILFPDGNAWTKL